MVIKQFRELLGESAYGDRSASSMSKCSVNSDLRNGSFWVESVTLTIKIDMRNLSLPDAPSPRGDSSWRSHQHTSDPKKCLQVHISGAKVNTVRVVFFFSFSACFYFDKER